jgi:hypothetical protein
VTDLVTAAVFREPWEAHLFCGRLKSEGVPAFVAHEHHVGTYWTYSTALGGAKVQVPFDRLADARSIEHLTRAGEFRALLQEEFGNLDDPHCPVCGSTVFDRRRPHYAAALAIFGLFLLGGLLPAWGWVCTCKNCGAKFERPRRPAPEAGESPPTQ